MITRIALLAASLAVAGSALAGAPSCSVTASGALKAAFTCRVGARSTRDGGIVLAFTPGRLPGRVGAFMAGPFEVPGPAVAGAYALPTLRSARMLISGPRHATYAAEAGQPARGDVTVTLTSVSANAGNETASGTVTARLVPIDRKGRGDVVVTVRFGSAERRLGAVKP